MFPLCLASSGACQLLDTCTRLLAHLPARTPARLQTARRMEGFGSGSNGNGRGSNRMKALLGSNRARLVGAARHTTLSTAACCPLPSACPPAAYHIKLSTAGSLLRCGPLPAGLPALPHSFQPPTAAATLP